MYYLHFDYRDDGEPQSETIIQHLRSPETQSQRECPDCGQHLKWLTQDGVYWCDACQREIEPDA